MWDDYLIASNVDDVLKILAQHGDRCRLIAGGTDLVLEMEKGAHAKVSTLVDISRISDFDRIEEDSAGNIHLGPLVTHNQCLASSLLRKKAWPLVQACWQVGSPQIRNRGTIAGNLITASPANDTITPLMALGARVHLRSARGERKISLEQFYTGVRKTVLQADEMLVDIILPPLGQDQRGGFVKLALRKAQAISLLNMTIIFRQIEGCLAEATITLGAVAPTIIHAREAESFLNGKRLDDDTIHEAARLIGAAAHPIDDIRSSALYRQEMARVLARRSLEALQSGEDLVDLPERPVLLATELSPGPISPEAYRSDGPIITTINGRPCTIQGGGNKTLAHLLREEGQLTGTKIACEEGECGACTIWLDGKAVMSCLVPAPRAHGADIVTVEGLERDGVPHPVQSAFIEHGAVQCGFCTPGFLMSAVKLLDENPRPTHNDILYGVSGNLCRCTGYYKIIEAIESAASGQSSPVSVVR
ncbi:MAG: FAD binding domain-containing protein [Anaerolineaceae bacterium]|nr:FAD binding domain-containing protein [Anaerolineaceae bacterium]